MKTLYSNPPNKNDFKHFQNLSNYQIVVLCEFELLKKNKKFTRTDGPNPNQLLNNFINNWIKNEFENLSFSDRADFQLDIQKIIPFNWASHFPEMADKNHLSIFKDQLDENESKNLNSLLEGLNEKWECDYREYKSVSILTDQEMIVKWNEEKGSYEEIK